MAQRAGPAKLDVYDASGRLIRRLLDGAVQPGEHQASWDGRDNDGRPVASGVYFYRLKTGDISQTKKMILLK